MRSLHPGCSWPFLQTSNRPRMASADAPVSRCSTSSTSAWRSAAARSSPCCWFGKRSGAVASSIGWSKRLQYMISPFVDTLNAVPRVTLLPLLIIWFGIGIWSKVVVVFLGAVIPILINTQSGVKTSEARFIQVARTFSASRMKIFSSIILPGTVPFIFTGLKYGAGRALLGVVVGELYASTAGLGHMIAEAGNTFQTDVVFFGVLVFMATGLSVVALLDAVERRFEKWRPHPR